MIDAVENGLTQYDSKSKAYISDSDDENDEAPVSASRPGSEEPLHQKDDEREQSEAHTPAKSQNDEDSGMDVDQNGNDEDEDE